MDEIEVTIRRVALPDGPRGTMARLRGEGHLRCWKARCPCRARPQWSYIAGPRWPHCTQTKRRPGSNENGRVIAPGSTRSKRSRRSPTGGLGGVRFEGELPGRHGLRRRLGGVLGYDLARIFERLPDRPSTTRAASSMVDGSGSGARDFITRAGNGGMPRRVTRRRWPWARTGREPVWKQRWTGPVVPCRPRRHWHAEARTLRTARAQFESGVKPHPRVHRRGDVLAGQPDAPRGGGVRGRSWALYEDLACGCTRRRSRPTWRARIAIASCSPERFLHRRGDEVEARPIKGTAARGADDAEDMARASWLAASLKDRAENLMIVDLMRNDLGRVAATGSVRSRSSLRSSPTRACGRWCLP